MDYEILRLRIQNCLCSFPAIKINSKLILDLGCGQGYHSLNIAKHNPRSFVYGIDLCHTSIEIAKREQKKYNLNNVNFLVGDATDMYFFKDRSIDFVYCNFLFNQLKNVEICLREIYRILTLEGKLLIIEGINQQWEWPSVTLIERKYNEAYVLNEIDKGHDPNIAYDLVNILKMNGFYVDPKFELVFMQNIPTYIKYSMLRMELLRMKANNLVAANAINKFKKRLFNTNFTSYTYLLKIIGSKQ